MWRPHPIHGLGWCSAWRVRTFDTSHAVIQHSHDGSIWPWAYEAEQAFTLTPGALRIVLTLRNRADSPMPCGLGLHPYFPKPAQTRLTTVVDGCWTTDDIPVPTAWRALDATERFDDGRLLDDLAIDQCFTGWTGHAVIAWPDRPFAVSLSASANADVVQLYAPPAQPFFCLEPMTHVPNTLDGPLLAPGAARSVTLQVAVIPISPR